MSSSHTPLSRDAIPVFNGDDDAYGWVLDIDRFFAETEISSLSKLLIAAFGLQGPPLQWWLQWSHHHPMASWESFIPPFLWHFKPEWQHLFPTPEEPCAIHADSVIYPIQEPVAFTSDLLDETVHVTTQPPPIQEPLSVVTAERSCLPFPIFDSDLDFPLNPSTGPAMDPFTASDPVSDSAAIAMVQMEQTSSLFGIPFLESVPTVVDEDDIVGLSLLDDALHFTVDASLTNTYPYDPGPILSQPLNNFLPMILQFFAPFEPPPPKPHGRSFPMRSVGIQVTSELTMPPPPLEPPDVKYGGVTTEFVSLSMLFDVHHMLDRRPLSRTCSFSLSTGCLQFKLWDPGWHFNFVVLWEFTIKICRDDLSTLNAISRVTPLQSKDNVTGTFIFSFFWKEFTDDMLLKYRKPLLRNAVKYDFDSYVFVKKTFLHQLSCSELLSMDHIFFCIIDTWVVVTNTVMGFRVIRIKQFEELNLLIMNMDSKRVPSFSLTLALKLPACSKIKDLYWDCGEVDDLGTNPFVQVHGGGFGCKFYDTQGSLYVHIIANSSNTIDVAYMLEALNWHPSLAAVVWEVALFYLLKVTAHVLYPFPLEIFFGKVAMLVNIVGLANALGLLDIGGQVVYQSDHITSQVYEALVAYAKIDCLFDEGHILKYSDTIAQYFQEVANSIETNYATAALIGFEDILHQPTILAHISDIKYFELASCHYLSNRCDSCNIESWALTAPTFILSKAFVAIDDTPASTSLYGNVLVFMSVFCDPEQLMLVNLGPHGYITLLRMGSNQQWDPGEHFQISKALSTLQSKQWDPGKFFHGENFYNLEDKVDFEGVGNDTVMGLGGAASNTILWRLLGLLNSPLQFLGVSFSYALWLIYSL